MHLQEEFLELAKNNDISLDEAKERLKDLVSPGLDVNKPIEVEYPLYESAFWGNDKLAELLLKAGADIHDNNKNGKTALHKAAEGINATLAGSSSNEIATSNNKPNQSSLSPKSFVRESEGQETNVNPVNKELQKQQQETDQAVAATHVKEEQNGSHTAKEQGRRRSSTAIKPAL